MASLARPHVTRRKRWVRVAIATILLAQSSALAIALSHTPTTHVVTRVEHMRTTEVLAIPSPPVIVQMPVAAPPSPTDTRACPTPRTDAPHLVPPQLEIEPTGLAVSPTNAGWIAAWNDKHVFVSTDAGRTFRRTLDGKGAVQDVQFDCFGHAIVARDDQLGIADGTHEVWRTIPGIDLSKGEEDAHWDDVSIIGGGRDVIVLGTQHDNYGRARVAVSRDLGASWTYHDLSEYTAAGETVAGLQREDGTILVGTAIPDCMSEEIGWIEIAPDGTSKTSMMRIYGLDFQFWGEWVLSEYGRRKIHAPDDTPWEPYPAKEFYGHPIPAPYPVFVNTERMGRLVGTTLHEYSWEIEGEQMQMDPAGRLWSISCGRLWIARDRASGYCPAPEGA